MGEGIRFVMRRRRTLMTIKKVLTIAGSDCSGGAGIQADIKTIAAHKMYAMSVITALTAQNTTGVYAVHAAPAEFVAKQMDCVFKDISPDAVKIGMVAEPLVVRAIADKLKEYKAKNIVVDPVMVSTSGSKLMDDAAIEVIIKELFPLAAVITPNIFEAEVLTDMKIKTKEKMLAAAQKINVPVLIKGGHLKDSTDDLLFTNGAARWFNGQKINNPDTHGTGCTLSSAIACGLAADLTLEQSIARAKEYVTGALKQNFHLGRGRGPLNHCY